MKCDPSYLAQNYHLDRHHRHGKQHHNRCYRGTHPATLFTPIGRIETRCTIVGTTLTVGTRVSVQTRARERPVEQHCVHLEQKYSVTNISMVVTIQKTTQRPQAVPRGSKPISQTTH